MKWKLKEKRLFTFIISVIIFRSSAQHHHVFCRRRRRQHSRLQHCRWLIFIHSPNIAAIRSVLGWFLHQINISCHAPANRSRSSSWRLIADVVILKPNGKVSSCSEYMSFFFEFKTVAHSVSQWMKNVWKLRVIWAELGARPCTLR